MPLSPQKRNDLSTALRQQLEAMAPAIPVDVQRELDSGGCLLAPPRFAVIKDFCAQRFSFMSVWASDYGKAWSCAIHWRVQPDTRAVMGNAGNMEEAIAAAFLQAEAHRAKGVR